MWRACIAPPQKPPSYSVSNSYAKTNIIRRTVSIGIITREIELNSHIISPCRCEYLKTFVSKQTLFIVSKHSSKKIYNWILFEKRKMYLLYTRNILFITALTKKKTQLLLLKMWFSRTRCFSLRKYLNKQTVKGYEFMIQLKRIVRNKWNTVRIGNE